MPYFTEARRGWRENLGDHRVKYKRGDKFVLGRDLRGEFKGFAAHSFERRFYEQEPASPNIHDRANSTVNRAKLPSFPRIIRSYIREKGFLFIFPSHRSPHSDRFISNRSFRSRRDSTSRNLSNHIVIVGKLRREGGHRSRVNNFDKPLRARADN